MVVMPQGSLVVVKASAVTHFQNTFADTPQCAALDQWNRIHGVSIESHG
jgi:hypothetical protein